MYISKLPLLSPFMAQWVHKMKEYITGFISTILVLTDCVSNYTVRYSKAAQVPKNRKLNHKHKCRLLGILRTTWNLLFFTNVLGILRTTLNLLFFHNVSAWRSMDDLKMASSTRAWLSAVQNRSHVRFQPLNLCSEVWSVQRLLL